MGGFGEGVQELSEELIDYYSKEIANEFSGYANPEKLSDALKRGGSAFGQAFVSSIIMGLSVSVATTHASVKKAKKAGLLMKVLPKESFMDSKVVASLKPEGMDDATYRDYVSKQYDRVNAGKDNVTVADSAGSGNVVRLSNSRLYETIEDISTGDDGNQEKRLLVGDPSAQEGTRGKMYGFIGYSVNRDETQVDITGVSMDGHDDIVSEAIQDLIAEYPHADITWDTQGNDALSAVKEKIVSANPRGREAGLQYAEPGDVAGRSILVKLIQNSFRNLDGHQTQVMADIITQEAQANGQTVTQFISENFGKDAFRAVDNRQVQDVADSVREAAFASYQEQEGVERPSDSDIVNAYIQSGKADALLSSLKDGRLRRAAGEVAANGTQAMRNAKGFYVKAARNAKAVIYAGCRRIDVHP